MKLISEATEIGKILQKYIERYNYISFAVAWVSLNPTTRLLLTNKYKTKITNCVVGLHFTQTDPNFIEPFIENGPIKFIKQEKGVFHPKIYLFWDNSLNWICLIGSANFTKSALTDNEELMTLIDSEKNPEMFDSIQKTIEYYNSIARHLTKKEFEDYKKEHTKKHKDKKQDDNFKEINSLNLLQLMNNSWNQYYTKLTKTRRFQIRLQLLSQANKLFKSSKFQNLDESTRKNIGGVTKVGHGISDWHLFGRMPVPYFANRLSDKDEHQDYKTISTQLDCIPLTGEVTKMQYDNFLNYFKTRDNWGYSISTLSRLLAMKRPDQFFCLTKANEPGLLKALSIPTSIQHDSKEAMYERYWGEVIEPIRKSSWNTANHSINSKQEQLAWNYRVAMLDALLYIE